MMGRTADMVPGPRNDPGGPDVRPQDASPTTMAVGQYQRVVRVVSYLFIAAVAAGVTLTGGPFQAAVYALLVIGIVLLVLFQDLLPTSSLARLRIPLEGGATIAFLTVLVMLTGGFTSPYFFGYILLLGAGSLWATGFVPGILTMVTATAYVAGVAISSTPALFTTDGVARVAFNVVSLGLVSYVAAVFGREQRSAREEALRLSRFDPLTSLHSRLFFTSTVEREIPRAARTGRPFAMLMFDLDGLKAANDRFGHEAGDQLLQAVADVLRGDIRVTDVAARYAGDEFVLLLPETDLAGALRVAEKLRVDISRLALPHDGSLVRTSASIGVVTYPEDGRAWAELIRRADLAMYEAKRRGRDQIVHYARSAPEPPPATATAPHQASSEGAHVAVGPGRRSGPGNSDPRRPPDSSGPPGPPRLTSPPDQTVHPTAPSVHDAQRRPSGSEPAASIPEPVYRTGAGRADAWVAVNQRAAPAAGTQAETSGVSFGVPAETPHPAPWERRGD